MVENFIKECLVTGQVTLTHPQWPARTCEGWTAAGPGRASGCSAWVCHRGSAWWPAAPAAPGTRHPPPVNSAIRDQEPVRGNSNQASTSNSIVAPNHRSGYWIRFGQLSKSQLKVLYHYQFFVRDKFPDFALGLGEGDGVFPLSRVLSLGLAGKRLTEASLVMVTSVL